MQMPKWVYIAFYAVILVFSCIAQNVEGEDKSKLFYSLAINVLAAEVFIEQFWIGGAE